MAPPQPSPSFPKARMSFHARNAAEDERLDVLRSYVQMKEERKEITVHGQCFLFFVGAGFTPARDLFPYSSWTTGGGKPRPYEKQETSPVNGYRNRHSERKKSLAEKKLIERLVAMKRSMNIIRSGAVYICKFVFAVYLLTLLSYFPYELRFFANFAFKSFMFVLYAMFCLMIIVRDISKHEGESVKKRILKLCLLVVLITFMVPIVGKFISIPFDNYLFERACRNGDEVVSMLEEYHHENGEYPNNLEELNYNYYKGMPTPMIANIESKIFEYRKSSENGTYSLCFYLLMDDWSGWTKSIEYKPHGKNSETGERRYNDNWITNSSRMIINKEYYWPAPAFALKLWRVSQTNGAAHGTWFLVCGRDARAPSAGFSWTQSWSVDAWNSVLIVGVPLADHEPAVCVLCMFLKLTRTIARIGSAGVPPANKAWSPLKLRQCLLRLFSFKL
jgi:hypothetical protein